MLTRHMLPLPRLLPGSSVPRSNNMTAQNTNKPSVEKIPLDAFIDRRINHRIFLEHTLYVRGVFGHGSGLWILDHFDRRIRSIADRR